MQFYTVFSEMQSKDAIKFGDRFIEKVEYSTEQAEKLIDEAKGYYLSTEETYEHEGYGEHTSYRTAEITPEQIIVKDGRFYGCMLSCVSGYSSIHGPNKKTTICYATVDKPTALTEDTEIWNNVNGDSSRTSNTTLTKRNR